MKIRIRDVLTLGLALFAMFFGSGNVIFPPFLGMQTTPNWFVAICAYLAVDIIIAVFSIVVMAKNDEGLVGITQRIGKYPSIIVSMAIILCIGPLICIPRAAAVSFDLLMVPLFNLPNNGWEQIVFSFVFFLVTWCLVCRPSKIVDIVGNILTPLLLVTLAMLIIKGIITPDPPMPQEAIEPNAVGVGIVAGYQSMDLFGALSFGTIMITTSFIKGYKTPGHRVQVLSWAGILSLVLLFATSIGMAYLGSRVADQFGHITSQAVLVSNIASEAFSFGGILLGVLASLACLTTAIGLTSGTSVYFKNYVKERNNRGKAYEILCTIVCCVSFIISNLGLELIVEWASPVLTLIFPMAVVLVILSWFNTKIKSDRVYIFAALFAFVSNFFVVINEWVPIHFIMYLPFVEMQLGWIIPVLIGIALGFILGRGHDDRMKLKIYRYNLEHADELKKKPVIEPVNVEKERAKRREQRKKDRVQKKEKEKNG